jgi:hypothetical protein
MWGIWAIFFHGKSLVYVENIFFKSKFGEISPQKKKKHITLECSCFTSSEDYNNIVLHHIKITP